MKTEVAVIGAGPAGSSAALALSKEGVSNVLIDKKNTVGTPVQCAEFVGLNINTYVNLSGIPSAVSQSIKFMDIDVGSDVYRFDGRGYMLNRDVFDRYMADSAVRAGTRLLTASRVFNIDGRKNCIDVLDLKENKPSKIYYDYLIVAAGPKSTLSVIPKNRSYIFAAQVKVNLLKGLDSVICFFRPYIPYGYGWIFPKGRFANAGIGIEKPISSMPLSFALDKFLEEMRAAGFIGTEIAGKTSGIVPVSGLNDINTGNILLCGDAAGLAHPITGAGILNAVMSGELAGNYTAESVKTSKNLLNDYREEIESVFEKPMRIAFEKRSVLYPSMTDREGISGKIKYLWPSFNEYYCRT